MGRIIQGAIIGAVIGFIVALAINELIFAGPEYGDALAWAAVGAIVGALWRAIPQRPAPVPTPREAEETATDPPR